MWVWEYVWKATKRPVVAKHTHTPTYSHTHIQGALIVQLRRLTDSPISALFSCGEAALERIVPACKSE